MELKGTVFVIDDDGSVRKPAKPIGTKSGGEVKSKTGGKAESD